MNEELKDKLYDVGIAFFKMIIAFIILGISIIFGGYVTMYLWNGIMTPTFQLIELTWAQATGIDLLISFLVAKRKPKNDDSLLEIFLGVILSNLLFMMIGWIVMMFI